MGRYVNPVIEPNRTPVVRLDSVIIALSNVRSANGRQSYSIKRAITKLLFVLSVFFFLERFSSLIMITPEQFTYQKMESEQT